MEYTYEILKASPKREFLSVMYKAEGKENYFFNTVPQDWSTEYISMLIENGGKLAVDFWKRTDLNPETVEDVIPMTGAGVSEGTEPPPPYVEPAPPPEYDIMLQTAEYNQEENTWTVIDLPSEEKAFRIRDYRNYLLSKTDYVMFPDTVEPSQDILDYRQALRDITSQPTFPDSVIWPELPA